MLIITRPLESTLFGVQIASCAPTTAADAPRTVAEARSVGCELLISRAPIAAIELAQAIEQSGGVLCDVLITCAREIRAADAHAGGTHTGAAAAEWPRGYTLREATSDDSEAVADVAGRAFSQFSGHWHSDKRISEGLATELYRRWGRDLVARMSIEAPVYVVDDAVGSVRAFLALRHHPDGSTDVPLTAVAPEARGAGLLRRMLDGVTPLLMSAGRKTFTYETQIVNVPALRTVTRAGFLPVGSRLTFHTWLDG